MLRSTRVFARRLALAWLFVALAAGPAAAQSFPCLRDADGDGHPIFGNPRVRTRLFNRPGLANSVSYGDLNGDGHLDAAVTHVSQNESDAYITLHFNHGDGVFSKPILAPEVGLHTAHVELADLNGDGLADLVAVKHQPEGKVLVMINKGGGDLAAPVFYATGPRPHAVCLGDVDGDGDVDVVTLNLEDHSVSVLLNNGDGSLAPEKRYSVGGFVTDNPGSQHPGPFHTLADLDGDGDLDIAIPSNGTVRILLNSGAGVFTPAAVHPKVAAGGAFCIAAGDLDGDGDIDLAVACRGPGLPTALTVLLNRGGGVFAPAVGYNVWEAPTFSAFATTVSLGDADGDGDLDVALGNEKWDVFFMFHNLGDGTFDTSIQVPNGSDSWFVRWAQLDGAGAFDLGAICTELVRSVLGSLIARGDGALWTYERQPPGVTGLFSEYPIENWNWVEAGDLDGDGHPDVAVTLNHSEKPNHLRILRNDGTGTFEWHGAYPLGPVGEAAGAGICMADLDGDGHLDLAIADTIVPGGFTAPGKVHILFNAGDGMFGAPVAYPFDGLLGGLVPTIIAPADLDGDGHTDLAVYARGVFKGDLIPAPRAIILMFNDGAGGMEIGAVHLLGEVLWSTMGSVSAGDLDGDGHIDLACAFGAKGVPGKAMILLNDGAGSFRPGPSYAVAPQPASTALRDLDGDGDLDLVILHNHNFSYPGVEKDPHLSILYNTGDGMFEVVAQPIDPALVTEGRIVVPDLNNDGRPDLVFLDVFGNVVVGLQMGPGVFTEAMYGTAFFPQGVCAADFDGDGAVDVLTTKGSSSSQLCLLRNIGCPPCLADCDKSGTLDIDDFLCFQLKFALQDPYADCDGNSLFNIDDFLCFQLAFALGC